MLMVQGCATSCICAASAANSAVHRHVECRPTAAAVGRPAGSIHAVAARIKVNTPCCSWQHAQPQQQCRRRLAPAHAALPPGMESAATGGATGALQEGLQGMVGHHAVLYALELLLAGAAAYAAAVWPTRPRGWAFKELIEVRGRGRLRGTSLLPAPLPLRPHDCALLATRCLQRVL